MIVVSILASLIVPLLVLGLIVRFVVSRVGSGDAPVARTIGALAHIGVSVTAINAVADLIAVAVPGSEIFEDTTRLVSFDVATLVVAVPVAFVIWRALFANEHDFARRLSVVGGLSIVMVTALVSVARLLFDVLDGGGLDQGVVGLTFAFGLAWIGYEWLSGTERGEFEVSDLRETVGAATGLTMTLSGSGLLVALAVSQFLPEPGDVVFDRPLSESFSVIAVLLVVGVPTLYWFWFRDLSRRETRFRNGYAAVVTYLALSALASSAGVLVYLVLEALLGFGSETAGSQFEPVPGLVASGLIALVAWLHHLDVLQPRRGLARRSYSYAVLGSSLLVAAGGVVTLVGAALESVSSNVIDATDVVGSIVLGGGLALVVGGLIWSLELRNVDLDLLGERESTPRRFYLTGLLVVTGVTGGVALVIALFEFLRSLLEGELGSNVIFDARVQIALVVVAAPLVWYLLAELRADRAMSPKLEALRSAMVIAGSRGTLRPEIVFVARADGAHPVTEPIARMIEDLLASPGSPLLITVNDHDITAIEVDTLPA